MLHQGPQSPWATNLRDNIHVAATRPMRSTPRSSGKRSAIIVQLLHNDGGKARHAAGEPAVPCKAFSFEQLLDAATQKLGLSWPARRLFSVDGTEITSLEGVPHGMELVVSQGEAFAPLVAAKVMRAHQGQHSDDNIDLAGAGRKYSSSSRGLWRTARATASESDFANSNASSGKCTTSSPCTPRLNDKRASEDKAQSEAVRRRFYDIRKQSRDALRHENFV